MTPTKIETFEKFFEEVLSLGRSDGIMVAYNEDGSLKVNENNEIEIVCNAPDSLLFRGQTDNFPLIPKLGRKKDNSYIFRREKALIDELKRRGDKLTQSGQFNDWELLVYAQHFGLATRLLDWTTNPLVSLWFACIGETKTSGFVYILKQTDENMLNITETPNPFEITKTKIFRPNLNNERIIAQNGWFTAHSLVQDKNEFRPLTEELDFERQIWLLEIPKESKGLMLLKLNILGINYETIYPGIEGTCRHINWLNNI